MRIDWYRRVVRNTDTHFMSYWEAFLGNENGKKSEAKTSESHRGRWF